ncbi:cytochrome P450 [Polyangium sp. y55x31]|uniref:cytochrome P450 n=1 Tax=Polyangium sp. y55x31 TaxID=3042688 RepID=UPI0024823AD6|nr:cytochrome P450 [Polyangium sp. y55x31]MDI1475018.1 cytochrome P450 [Polyangium sp. y55x31]
MDGPSFLVDPHPTYRWLRENAPTYQWQARHTVVFSRYRDVKAILNDRRFSNNYRAWEFAQPEQWPPELIDFQKLLDNGLSLLPDHRHGPVRRLVSSSLTVRSVERMQTRIQQVVDELIDTAVEGDRLNLTKFAETLPTRVICDLLAIPAEMREDLCAFGLAAARSANIALPPDELIASISPTPRWVAMLRRVIADRRENPREDDLLSTLIMARDEGAKLTEEELLSLVFTFFVAGGDSTKNAITWGVRTLLRHPADLAEVQRDPSLWRNAAEETLRFEMFAKSGFPKYCTEAMEFAGVSLRKGQMVLPLIAAALRDGEAFPDPDRFDIRRDLRQTISFGSGQQTCLGAALARMQLVTALGTLFRRFPDMKPLGEPEFEPHPLIRSMKKFEVALH